MKLREILQSMINDPDTICKQVSDGAETYDLENLLEDLDVLDDDREYCTSYKGIHLFNEDGTFSDPPMYKFIY